MDPKTPCVSPLQDEGLDHLLVALLLWPLNLTLILGILVLS